MIKEIKSDLVAINSNPIMGALSNRGFHALLGYRLSNFLWRKKIPILPLVITRFIQILYGIDIDYRATIKGGCVILHGVGVVIGYGASVGKNAIIYHGVTLGIAESKNSKMGFPQIGDNILIGAGAKLLGTINIGNNVKIGANAVVTKDIPDDCIAVGIPAKVINTIEVEKVF